MTINRTSLLVSTIALLICGLIASNGYLREADFVLYRLASNIQNGYGFADNPASSSLITVSPFFALPLALSPLDIPTSAYIANSIAYLLAGIALVRILRDLPPLKIILIIAIWVFSWPTWVTFGSSAPLVMMLALWAFERSQRQQYRLSGLLAGCTVLLNPYALGFIVLMGFGLPRRYWQTVWIPGMVWLVAALLSYDRVELAMVYTQASMQDGLWLMLIATALAIITRKQHMPLVWLLVTWGAFESAAVFVIAGEVTQFGSPALVLGLIMGLAHMLNPRLLMAVCVGVIGLMLIAPPQTASRLLRDLEQPLLAGSVLHDRTLAYHYSSEFPVYQGITEEQIIRLAPGYIDSTSTNIDWQSPNLSALNYIQAGSIWRRQQIVAPFGQTLITDFVFRPDVRLNGIRIDRERLMPGETFRLGLDWQLDNYPDSEVSLNFSLIDFSGQVMSSVTHPIPYEAWQNPEPTTYHAIQTPEAIPAGVYRLNLRPNYNAGILNEHTIYTITVLPDEAVIPDKLVGQLGSVALYESEIIWNDDQLQVDLAWGTDAALSEEYFIFLHFTAIDDPAPLRQADGPVQGGNFPSNFWMPGDVIRETRILSLADLPAGEYQINVGLYNARNERLRNEDADFLIIAHITLTEDGSVLIQP